MLVTYHRAPFLAEGRPVGFGRLLTDRYDIRVSPTEELRAILFVVKRLEEELQKGHPDEERASLLEALKALRKMQARVVADVLKRQLN